LRIDGELNLEEPSGCDDEGFMKPEVPQAGAVGPEVGKAA
jgi:hypothetical protein